MLDNFESRALKYSDQHYIGGMAMKTISAAEANRQFSRLLREVAQGESITVLSRGRPVATLCPPIPHSDSDKQSAKHRLIERLNLQKPSGVRDWTRDDLYAEER